MRKSYYCKFGTHLSISEVKDVFFKYFDVEFELHESSYIGEYYQYSGMLADKLRIHVRESASPDALSDEDYSNYACLIFLSNTTGKNADKLSKLNYVEKHLLNIESIALLHEKIVQEPN